jgi:class 3 adenylate cyclase/predicted ATPase
VVEGSKFCSQCGAALKLPCRACGNVNLPSSKFCSQCGEKLRIEAGQEERRVLAFEPALAERRHLTVMFCDLVGSTALSARLDVEDLRDVIGGYQKRVTEVVTSFGGFVARYLGDGVLVYFGYPNAHEDDPEQAVRAGLAVVSAVRELKGSERLEVRLGIATGVAVVGDLLGAGAAHDREIVGEMPNLAARLQALAEPNTIVIANSTRRLIGSVFELTDLGLQELKGFTQLQHAWRVVGEAQVGSRFEALRSTQTPLIGRDEEVDLLFRRWTQAKSGEGRAVLLSSEPGIGKSRLLVAFRERLGSEPHQVLSYFCSPHHQGSALFPIVGQIERAANFEREDTREQRLEKLERLLAPTRTSSEDVALFAELLLLPTAGRYSSPELTPQQKKEKTFRALLRTLAELANRAPILIVFEDLHWVDPTTREFLDLAIEQLQALPMLLLATFRPEFQPPWTDEPHVTVLNLTRLTRRQAEALVQKLTANAGPLSSDLLHEIVERADGVPLFLEELTKAVLEIGPQSDRARGMLSQVPATALGVPATLQASLMARLDRLGPIAKEIAQIAAAIGREFSFEILAMVAERPQAELERHLARLVESGLVTARGVPPAADFLFKHALIQDAAYGTLLRGPRATLHGRIAQVLEDNFVQVREGRPEIVARHFGAAGLALRAAVYWKQAGEVALRRSAAGEALAHFSAALEAVEHADDTAPNRELELDVRLGLGAALNTVRGSSHPEVAKNYARAVVLGREQGDTRQHFRAVWGSWYAAQVKGNAEQGLGLADELVALAQRLTDEDLALEAYHSRWASSHTLGLNGATLSDIERGISIYDPARHRGHAYHYGGHDTGVCARTHGAMTLWITGFPDRAAQMCVEAIALGRQLDHPPSLAHAAWWSATVYQMLRQPEPCREFADLAVQIARDQDSQIFVTAPVLLGWARSELGDPVAGLRDMEAAIAKSRRSVRRWYYDYELIITAEAMLKADMRDRALDLVNEALQVIETSGNRVFESEACRLRAASAADAAEAEHWITRALEVSEQQDARSLRLRAAVSFARIKRDGEMIGEARRTLASAYTAFTEGFSTADLVEAKGVLDILCTET